MNTHEGPEYLATWILERNALPRDWVVVVGGGAGGDARGYVKGGCNVAVIEGDSKQFANLCSQFAVMQASHDKDEEKKAPGTKPRRQSLG